ncbi:hypothetical protein K432DRAFT_284962 [Lepidopterella palustris CBS 459.81]|uniref:Uncharacterized protein n=1 Tax=Lepidopterella palustris CBS 459.81 TaxID=1314670 RepID=A0A8E2ELK7_9PEZI|nr:hypothetical protein K432DRAFT_284962 [Lepidopterella palustris CBS 459.81]
MDGVPNPLRVGSPAVGWKPSVDQVPSPLRVGSPIVERGSPFSQIHPPLQRRPTSDRLSQLFPSRPASVVSIPSDHDSSRRTSYPSPLTPASEPAYRIPRAPAPPTFSESTSYDPAPPTFPESTAYDPVPDPFSNTHPAPVLKSTGTQRLLSRLTSLRTARGAQQYGILEDQDGTDRPGGRLRGVDETEEHVPYDLSGLDGSPIAMKSMPPTKMKSAADSIASERELSEAGLAAEFDRLESQGKPGMLGGGMVSVIEAPFVHHPGPEHQAGGHRRGASYVEAAARQEAQRAAEKAGEILAVSDINMDISNLGGAEYDTISMMNSTTDGSPPAKTSYYFPPDPDMPTWRPMSMHWPYISLLIFIALALAGLQEFLCQLSIKRSAEGSGLLEFTQPQELSIAAYFTWKYAPVLVFVTYGILWQISDFEVKRLEPFYQLSKKTGATAAESLNMDYLTFMSWLVPLKALRYRQYAVIYSSLSTLVAGSLVPVLQSASINMYPPKKDRKESDPKYVRIDPRWSRAVTACLVFVAICGFVLLFSLRRKSGLQSDPKGIAGIAAMATRSHILNDFHGLDTAPQHLIHKQLRHRRYILHKSSLWQGEYIRNSTETVREHGTDSRPLMLTKKAGIPYICFMLAFACSIPVFMFVDAANFLTEKIPFLLTAIATIIKLLWNTIDCDVRMLEPFYILSRRRAPPRTLTLDYTGTMPGWLSIKALINRHYLVSLVGLGAILTEVLTVCVSSFSVDGKKFFPGHGHDEGNESNDRYNSDETFRSFWVSFALVIGILLYLIFIASLVYLRRSHKFMPRQIGTIASVLGFIHQSKMLVSFVDTEKFTGDKMTKYLEGLPKTYALGWFSGRDGEDHCGIDEEPLLAKYEYGVDWTKTRVLGQDIGTWENY